MRELPFEVQDLGRTSYADAYAVQAARQQAVIEARESGGLSPPTVGYLLLVEHDPVITISRRAGAAKHLVASAEQLANAGVAVAETDRGGDITYHGPGQLVVYPILDLSAMNLGLHAYMRMLESAVIRVCARFGVAAGRDEGATGVWTSPGPDSPAAKICAMGVRVKRWVSMHGLALNVSTNLAHFALIVPCGLAGRGVTSLEHELGPRCPSMDSVKAELVESLATEVRAAIHTAAVRRAEAAADSADVQRGVPGSGLAGA